MNKQRPTSKDRKSGQAIIFLIMVLVIGSIVVLWNFDLHNIVSTKIRIDNAGDASALSAARWQGITLNMIGELNLVQAAYICDEIANMDPASPGFDADLDALSDDIEFNLAPLRRRLSLIGPLMGMVAAQSSALLNLTVKDEQLIEEATSRFMAQRGTDFEDSGGYYMGRVEEPYPGAWEEYGGLLSAIAAGTMISESGNSEYFLYFNSSHPLLSPYFYEDVRAPDLCAFARGRYDLISSYVNYNDWGPMPDLSERNTVNSEYLSSQVYEFSSGASIDAYYSSTNWHVETLNEYYPDEEITPDELRAELIEDYMTDTSPTDNADLDMMSSWGANLWCTWHFFKQWSWLAKNGFESGMYYPDSDDFPFHEGYRFKEEYNYGGANAAVDVRIASEINTPGMQIAVGDIYWQAAAKPFGYLEDPGDSSQRKAPMYYGIVLPAFHDVRLIHNELSTRNSAVTSPDWDEHIYNHVEEYLDGGLPAIEENDCDYCDTLRLWDDDEYRGAIWEWVEENYDAVQNGEKCNIRYDGNPNMGRG